MDVDSAAIGRRIRARRRELDITQGQLASRLEVHQTTVAKWETGVNAIGVADLLRICRELDVTVEAVTTAAA
jgi:transcriptional regulator with XRE-family HTH domain